MKRSTLGLAVFVGGVALLARGQKASASSTSKPVRGQVTMGEPTMIINGKRTALSDRRAPGGKKPTTTLASKKPATTKTAGKKTAATKPVAKKTAAKKSAAKKSAHA